MGLAIPFTIKRALHLPRPDAVSATSGEALFSALSLPPSFHTNLLSMVGSQKSHVLIRRHGPLQLKSLTRLF